MHRTGFTDKRMPLSVSESAIASAGNSNSENISMGFITSKPERDARKVAKYVPVLHDWAGSCLVIQPLELGNQRQ